MTNDSHTRPHRKMIRWLLLGATILLLLAAVLSVWLPYHRRQQAIAGLQAAYAPQSLEIVRLDPAAPFFSNAIALAPGGPQWLRDLVGDQLMRPFDRVEAVGLHGIRSADKAARYLPQFPDLRDVYVVESDLTDAGLKHVAACRRIERLGLCGTKITGRGLEKISAIARLESLWLSDAATISDGGVHHLRSLKHLEMLYIRGAPITDAALEDIGRLPKLRRVGLGGTKVTPGAIKRLKQRRPSLEITYLPPEGTPLRVPQE